jgi:hypothetical protein
MTTPPHEKDPPEHLRPEGAPGKETGTAAAVPRTSTFRSMLWIGPPFVVGCVLRLLDLRGQVVSGDELHAVRAAIEIEFPKILVTYLLSDHCIPLSSFYRAAMLVGVPINETLLRAPVVLSGLLILLLVPWWAKKTLGGRTAQILAWWLAVSPLLVYYSRIVRSYMPIVLLGMLAVGLFWMWLESRRRWQAAAYVVTGALAIYFHPVAAPFVGAPLVWLGSAQLLKIGNLPRIRSTLAVGGGLAVAVAMFLIPAAPSLAALVQDKRVDNDLSLGTWQAVAALQAGTANPWLVGGFWLLAAIGLAALLVRAPRLGSFGVVLIAVQVVGLVVLSPLAMEQPNILNRYLLVAVPIVLVWVSYGLEVAVLGRIERFGRVGGVAASAVAMLLPAVYFAGGPLPDPAFLPGSFAHRSEFTAFYRSQRPRPPIELPEAYRWLADRRPGAILELPFSPLWRYATIFPRYQRTHGLEVVVGYGDRTLWDPRVRMRNGVSFEPERLVESRASWLVLHPGIADEEASNDRGRASPDSPAGRDRARRARMLERMERQTRDLERTLRRRWGPPDLKDDRHVVWDLDRVRRGERLSR